MEEGLSEIGRYAENYEGCLVLIKKEVYFE